MLASACGEHYNNLHMSTPTILVADDAASFQALRDALASVLPLARVGTLEQARRALDARPPVVVCGCHFDEGRMYDLLRHVKASAAFSTLPFRAVRCIEGELELDDALYAKVEQVLEKRKPEIMKILMDYGVPTVEMKATSPR